MARKRESTILSDASRSAKPPRKRRKKTPVISTDPDPDLESASTTLNRKKSFDATSKDGPKEEPCTAVNTDKPQQRKRRSLKHERDILEAELNLAREKLLLAERANDELMAELQRVKK